MALIAITENPVLRYLRCPKYPATASLTNSVLHLPVFLPQSNLVAFTHKPAYLVFCHIEPIAITITKFFFGRPFDTNEYFRRVANQQKSGVSRQAQISLDLIYPFFGTKNAKSLLMSDGCHPIIPVVRKSIQSCPGRCSLSSSFGPASLPRYAATP